MPKYIPSNEDLYSTKPCPVCGGDIVDMDAETCSDICDQQWRIFKEDQESRMFEEAVFDDEL